MLYVFRLGSIPNLYVSGVLVSSKADEGYWREKAAAFGAGRVRKGRGTIHVGVYVRTRPKYLGTLAVLWHCHV